MNNDDDNFENFLKNVVPLKKSNKLSKTIPKTKSLNKTKVKKQTKIKFNIEPLPLSTKPTLKPETIHTNKKLKKGQVPINKRIDFHGLSLNSAKTKFFETINGCFKKNERCILFITGKGLLKKNLHEQQPNKLYYGKIRNNFLEWIDSEQVSSKILNVQQANIENGGDGAFFVYLRKNKT